MMEIGDEYHDLPNLYAVVVVKKNGNLRKTLATIIVKTNMNEGINEAVKIFNGVVSISDNLKTLQRDDVTLVQQKINFDLGVIPSKDDWVTIMTDLYTRNTIAGHA